MSAARDRARGVRVTLIDPTGQPDPTTARDVEVDVAGSSRAAGADAQRAVVTPLRGATSGVSRLEVVVDGWRFELDVEDAARAAIRVRATREADAGGTSGPSEIRAIIPGRVAAVRVTAGDEVVAGDTLLVVEAMKMQNELRAARSGSVERVVVGEGQTIEIGDLLVVLS